MGGLAGRATRKPSCGNLGCREGFWDEWGVSEVQAAFVISPATMYGNHDDRALRLDGAACISRSWIIDSRWRRRRDSITPFLASARNYYHLRILACVYAGCNHILILGCSAELSPQSPQFSCFR
jgi:hypothetical protein